MKSHGYDEALGLAELNLSVEYSNRVNSWGIPDPILFRKGAEKIDELRKKGKPFNLTLMTINSHSPGFEDITCPKYTEDNTLLNGIHCTDHSLNWFINYLRNNGYFEDTIIVSAEDHVMFPLSVNSNLLNNLPELSWYGKTYVSIHDPQNRLPKLIDTVAYTPDLAPTILDLVGFGEIEFSNGRSIMGSRKKYQRIVTRKFEIMNKKQFPKIILNQNGTCQSKHRSHALRGNDV